MNRDERRNLADIVERSVSDRCQQFLRSQMPRSRRAGTQHDNLTQATAHGRSVTISIGKPVMFLT